MTEVELKSYKRQVKILQERNHELVAQLDFVKGEIRSRIASTPSLHNPSAGRMTPSLQNAASAFDLKTQIHKLQDSKEVKFNLEDNVMHKYVTEVTAIRL